MSLSTISSAAFRSMTRVSRPTSKFIPLSTRRPGQISRLQPLSNRFFSSEPPPSANTPAPTPEPRPAHAPPLPKQTSNTNTTYPFPSKPEYEMTFTCKPCSTRSSHRVSKQGYHYGSVLITCPECRNRHVISDHLNIFGDKHMTIEDLMREQGQLVKRGTLSEDGNVEFWVDGSVTKRGEGAGDAVTVKDSAEETAKGS
ncbi:zf-DNL-domain-containing protein [Mollisia scopiformis]|uniref:Zf-DNL-domain-containing protein n=1 Tax=Mollisia scopiformis TaxID=149040 RepID=A0A194XEG7_MOLSC|nr:zf-DNL-domain-containing protein [Mollisia scopiformis]KUJ18568.1 zf-DNL-domain-containing protein [Mollisia scopiformis]